MSPRRFAVDMAFAPPPDSTLPDRAGRNYVYTLCEPGSKRVRYVGVTRVPRTRWSTHLADAWLREQRGNHVPRTAWIAGLLAADSAPVLDVVEVVKGSAVRAHEREVVWIHRLGRTEALLNERNTGRASR